MTTSVDTNVIVALWDRDPAISTPAQRALDAALERGPSSRVLHCWDLSYQDEDFGEEEEQAVPGMAWNG